MYNLREIEQWYTATGYNKYMSSYVNAMFLVFFIYLFISLDVYNNVTYHLQNNSNMTYTVKIYARDVTTGDQHPMRLASIQINTSMFKKYII